MEASAACMENLRGSIWRFIATPKIYVCGTVPWKAY